MSNLLISENWRKEPEILKVLWRLLREGRVAFILGAGISKSLKIPLWEELIQRLAKEKRLQAQVSNVEPKRAAEIIRKQGFGGKTLEFNAAVKEALYRTYSGSFERLRKNETLAALSAIIMVAERHGGARVVNFNFDNIIEQYLAYHGLVAAPIFDADDWRSTQGVQIYHPHGFLPYGQNSDSPDLIFDQESYHVVNSASNPWNQRLVHILKQHFCIFIGLSGTDDRLDFILHDVQKVHPAIVKAKYPYMGLRLVVAGDQLNPIWQQRGIFCHQLDSYEEGIPAFLFKLCQVASKGLGK